MDGTTEILVLDRIGPDRRAEVLALYAETWWAAERSPVAVARMLDGSDVVGLVDSATDRLVGFARAITDGVFSAVVLDVIVDRAQRGSGLGARLVQELLARPDIAGVESIELVCRPELTGFYRRFGFTDAVGTSLLMRRTTNRHLTGG